MVDALILSLRERQSLTGATQGENSTYSESLLFVTGHGRKRISVHTGEFEHHVPDDDLDPWEFLERAGVVSEGDRANLVERDRLDDV